jgi:spermidine synthase
VNAIRLEEQLSAGFGYFVDAVKVLADQQSPFQRVQIIETQTFGTVLRLDGALQCSERDEFFYHEPLVHMALARAQRRAKVLIVGGGDGGAAEEVLKWPAVERVDHVEIDALVLALCEVHLRAVHRGVLSGADARYRQHANDGAHWVRDAASAGAAYDAIVLDLTDAGGPSCALYAQPFYRDCSRLLSPGGVLTLHLAAPWAQREQAARMVAVLRGAFAVVEPFVVSVPLSGGQWLMAACHDGQASSTTQLGATGAVLSGLNGSPLKLVTAQALLAMLQLPPYLAQALVPTESSHS